MVLSIKDGIDKALQNALAMRGALQPVYDAERSSSGPTEPRRHQAIG